MSHDDQRMRDLAIDRQIERLRALAAARCGLREYPAELIRQREQIARGYGAAEPDR